MPTLSRLSQERGRLELTLPYRNTLSIRPIEEVDKTTSNESWNFTLSERLRVSYYWECLHERRITHPLSCNQVDLG